MDKNQYRVWDKETKTMSYLTDVSYIHGVLHPCNVSKSLQGLISLNPQTNSLQDLLGVQTLSTGSLVLDNKND